MYLSKKFKHIVGYLIFLSICDFATFATLLSTLLSTLLPLQLSYLFNFIIKGKERVPQPFIIQFFSSTEVQVFYYELLLISASITSVALFLSPLLTSIWAVARKGTMCCRIRGNLRTSVHTSIIGVVTDIRWGLETF